MDKWDGYAAARERLYARLQETKAPNPIVLSGDVHVHYGADLKLDFANPQSATVGVEFTNTSITSGGDGGDVAADVGADQARQPAHQVPQRAPRLHRVHRDAGDACAPTSRSWTGSRSPDAPVRIGGSLVVEAGRPGAQTD